MKTKEELNALKKEAEALNTKLAELTEDELAQVVGADAISNLNNEPITIEINRSIFGIVKVGPKY